MLNYVKAMRHGLHRIQVDELPLCLRLAIWTMRCALIHYQFETIHPFNDGNGRVGRLLIMLYLVWRGILQEPMPHLSAYLKAHQQEYYDRLQQVRTNGNYEAWLCFFLEGIVSLLPMWARMPFLRNAKTWA